MTRPATPVAPRMLTAEQAAAYLGYATTGLLANIPVRPVYMAPAGPGSAPRYDRHALDAWLDRLSGLSVPGGPEGAVEPVEDADAIYARWKDAKAARGR